MRGTKCLDKCEERKRYSKRGGEFVVRQDLGV